MAERRMFAKTIVLSDAFLDMPLSARCLYFTLGMLADDDGFINSPKSIIRQCGASEDDMKVLIAKKFILPFDNGVIVIKHWRINNYLRSDRYKPTVYQEEMEQLDIDEIGGYSFGIPTLGIPSIGKDSIGNNLSISKDIDCQTEVRHDIEKIINKWNSLKDLGISPISKMSYTSNRYKWIKGRLQEYGLEEVLRAIDNIRDSDFLQGKTGKNPFRITFDWFARPNNFPKVLEGNYNNQQATMSATITRNDGGWQC